MTDAKAALVVGADDATGSAVARRFAKEGFVTCVARRHGDQLAPLVEQIEAEGGSAVPFGCDCRQEEQVVDLVETIERDIGPIEVAVHNIGANVRFPITETTARVYYKVWVMGCLTGFLTGREVARRMIQRRRGAIIFTGATASIRGAAGFAGFSGAKHGLRAVAQSMARELGPDGIHVAHVVIDGTIDTKWIEEMFPERYALQVEGGILNPDMIAENYCNLHCPPRSAWTHEMDLRPWMEPW